MKTLVFIFLAGIHIAALGQAFAKGEAGHGGHGSSTDIHSAHPPHNMVLFGEGDAYYASHIVYKKPHNYQVILRLILPQEVKTQLALSMNESQKNQFIFLLDSMDIGSIQTQPPISGSISKKSNDGQKVILYDSITLQPNQYSIIYFNELPLSLDNAEVLKAAPATAETGTKPFEEDCRIIKCQ